MCASDHSYIVSNVIDRTVSTHEDEFDSQSPEMHDHNSVSIMEIETSGDNEPICSTSSNIISEEIMYDDQVLIVNSPPDVPVMNIPVVDVFARPSLSRKKMRNPTEWKQAKRKSLKNSGQSYTSSKGKIVEKRQLKPSRCEEKHCKMKCHLKVNEDERVIVFEHYWNTLGEYQRQQDYLINLIETHTPKNRTVDAGNSRRKQSAFYYLPKGRGRIKVCRDFFLATLGESPDRMRYPREREMNLPGKSFPDQRGRHKKRVTSSDLVNQVREHIHLYPAVEGHYVRARSERKYLREGLNMNEMYSQYVNCRNSVESW